MNLSRGTTKDIFILLLPLKVSNLLCKAVILEPKVSSSQAGIRILKYSGVSKYTKSEKTGKSSKSTQLLKSIFLRIGNPPNPTSLGLKFMLVHVDGK